MESNRDAGSVGFYLTNCLYRVSEVLKDRPRGIQFEVYNALYQEFEARSEKLSILLAEEGE